MKILVIGIVASGKTTLSMQLSKKLNIPHFEIDSIVHDDENARKRTLEEQLNIINELDKNNNSWLIEGTLRNNLDILLEKADKIIYLDIPLNIRRKRIITRYIKQLLHIEKSNYKPTLTMLKSMFKWTNEYEKNKSKQLNRLQKYSSKVIMLNKSEITQALSKLNIN